eukprot:Sspe_Gene.82183::Locus_53862_Transcript_1_1_Confidence_1.000_Length_2753::g.82183::m.82183/K13103/TFIP11; tuftelin-interacting protein 11
MPRKKQLLGLAYGSSDDEETREEKVVFEGWEDPFESAKRGQKRSKMEAWLGESDDEEPRGKARRPAFSASGQMSGMVQFVSGGSRVIGHQEEDEKKKDEQDGDAGSPAKKKYTISFASEEDAPKAPKKLSKKEVDANLSFLKNSGKSKAILKMMENAGWKAGEGMGKHGQGISEAISVKLRPKNAGVGAIDEKTDQQRRMERRQQGAAIVDFDSDDGELPTIVEDIVPDDEKMPPRELKSVKLNKREARKGAWKKVDDVIKLGSTAEAPDKIIDMRGVETRTLDSLAEAGKAPEAAKRSGPKTHLQDLRTSLGKLLQETEAQVMTLDMRLEGEKERAAAIDNQLQKADDLEEGQNESIRRVESMVKMLERLHEKVTESLSRGDDGRINPTSLARSIEGQMFREGAPLNNEYKMFQHEVNAIAATIVRPLFKRHYKGWSVAREPEKGLQELKVWRKLLRGKENTDSPSYQQLVWENVGQVLRSFATSQWKVESPQLLTDLLKPWFPLLPPSSRTVLLEGTILPKLCNAIENSSPRNDALSLHEWVLPWVEYSTGQGDFSSTNLLEDKGILAAVRIQLSSAFQRLGSSDPLHALHTVRNALNPWNTIFPYRVYQDLLDRHVEKHFSPCLKAATFFPNAAFDDSAALRHFQAVVEWGEVNQMLEKVVDALAADFFMKMIDVLAQYLHATGDVKSVFTYYKIWKARLPEQVLTHPRIEACLNMLVLMQRAALEYLCTSPAKAGAPSLADVQQMNEAAANRRARVKAAPAQQRKQQEALAAKSQAVDDMSLREHIEALAAEESLSFVPRRGLRENGKQVYNLGHVPVYFDKNCMYVQSDGKWTPADTITEVFDRAKQRKAPSRKTATPPPSAADLD